MSLYQPDPFTQLEQLSSYAENFLLVHGKQPRWLPVSIHPDGYTEWAHNPLYTPPPYIPPTYRSI